MSELFAHDELERRNDPAALFACLQNFLQTLGATLRSFPATVISEALEQAEATAIDAICTGLAARLSVAARRRWLRVVALNAARTLTRHKRPVPLTDDVAPAVLQSEWPHPDCRTAILAAVGQLPPGLRAVVECVYFEGNSGRAAARRLGLPAATLRHRHRRALDSMRRQLRGLDL